MHFMFKKFYNVYSKKISYIEVPPFFGFHNEIDAIQTGISILNDIYKRELKDYQKYKNSDETHTKKYKKRKLRFLSNYTSYLNTIYNLERILERSYEKIIKTLTHLGIKIVFNKINVENRKKEIEAFIQFRHKVFAHTSFGYPREDSDSIQAASLLFFTGNFYLGAYRGTGGSGININGKCEILPIISIIDDHQKNIQHYENWENLFLEIFNTFDKIDIDANRLASTR